MKKIAIVSQTPPYCGTNVLTRKIASDIALKNPLIDEIISILQKEGFLDSDESVWTRLCLDEAVINAIKHGNRDDKKKSVTVSLFISKQQWAIRVEDEGEGFKTQDIPDVDVPQSLELEHGRGILLMQSYMDEIIYYDKGNRLQLTKRRKNRFLKILDHILLFLKLK